MTPPTTCPAPLTLTTADLADLRVAAQDRLFAASDSCSRERLELVTAAWRDHSAEPIAIRRALALARVFDQGSVVFDPSVLFAGTTSEAPRAWTLYPECGIGVDQQVLVELDGFEGLCDNVMTADEQAFWDEQGQTGGFAGLGHLAVDYHAVVERGLAAIRAEAAGTTGGDPAVREAMVIALDATMRWASRCARAATDAATIEPVSARAEALRMVARACAHVPAQPARSLHEALQAVVLVHCALVLEGQGTSLSVGRLDRILERFEPEIAADPERAAELIGAALVVLAGNSCQGRSSKTQAITAGGPDAQPVVTMAVLEAFARTPVADPHLFLRWHQGIDPGCVNVQQQCYPAADRCPCWWSMSR